MPSKRMDLFTQSHGHSHSLNAESTSLFTLCHQAFPKSHPANFRGEKAINSYHQVQG